MNPRNSALPRPLAMELARTEYDRCLDLFRSLTESDWATPTDCPAWDVRQMGCHMLGMVEMAASVRENVRQQRKASRAGGDPLDALTALQVAEREDWLPQRLVEVFAVRAPKAAIGRRRAPALIRKRAMPGHQDVNGAREPWSFGYLVDVILTRDPWMHRIDIAHATGRPLRVTEDHDGVIVADVVAEWAGRHGKDFDLTLTGPAGGKWQVGSDGPALTFDAIEFCRALALRPAGIPSEDLMGTAIAF
ncbi:MAG: maleylpyruvate isomerase family mycothiol-dependent enzyme [Nakamurella sp.]